MSGEVTNSEESQRALNQPSTTDVKTLRSETFTNNIIIMQYHKLWLLKAFYHDISLNCAI